MKIAEMGAYTKLLEYDNIDGMILLSELSRRRIRSIQKLIRIGRNEVVVVLRVDKEKGESLDMSAFTNSERALITIICSGYIDLSKRRVSPEDIVKCEERFNKGKMAHSVLRHVAEKTRTPLEEIYKSIAWPLNKRFGHAVDAFKLSITNPEVWDDIDFPTDVIKQELLSYIAKRLTPQAVRLRTDIEVTCFAYNGIEAIKDALRQGEGSGAADQVKVRLISPPLYVMTSQSLDKNVGIKALEVATKEVQERIQSRGGSCVVRMLPKAVNESDDAELQALMDKKERENQEISGDDDESESDAAEDFKA